jgi:hypothetical protein
MLPGRGPSNAPNLVAAVAGSLALLLGGACNPPREVVPAQDLRIHRPGATALVVVYSRSGHTARAGRAVAEELGADFLRIQGQGREGDSFFSTPSSTATVAVVPSQVDLRPYRTVIVGTPIWYWRPTALARTLIAASPVEGKRLVLLYTYEGGVSMRSLTDWARQLGVRGARVIDVVGVDRKHLPAGETVEGRARQLARERRTLWIGR